MIPDLSGCLEVARLDSWPPFTEEAHQTQSALARKINRVIRQLLLVGVEPDQITIDIDKRAVIVREDSNIHLRTL